MPRTGTALAPLHDGRCPPWLFRRMKRLAGAVTEAIVVAFGPHEVLRRLADPVWFQSFGSLLGFDWHSSGLTTVVLGALKEALRERGFDLGVFVVGGKGRAALGTPRELDALGSAYGLNSSLARLVQVSRLAAKVDNAMVQDGHTLYHHVLLFDRRGNWAVVQQGMDQAAMTARRYHWLSDTVRRPILEPHNGVVGRPRSQVLDLTAEANVPLVSASLEVVHEPPRLVLGELRLLRAGPERHLLLPRAHPVPDASRLERVLQRIYERRPATYEDLLDIRGVGAKTLRAVAMVAEVVFGATPAFSDPARYSFAHGGKDGYPYPVDRRTYDETVAVLEGALARAHLAPEEKTRALRRLLGRPVEQPQLF